MKKTILKTNYMALSLALVLSASACGGGAGPKAPATTTPQTSEATGNTEPAAGSGAATQLSVEVFERGNTGGTVPTNNFWTDYIKENVKKDLNIDVSFVAVPRAEEVNKLNVLMAAGQAPDISFTYTKSVVYNFYKDGGLADLSDAMTQYGSELASFLGEDVLKEGVFGGKQYAIPAKRISRAKTGLFMRKDWLDILGLPVPQTREEYHQALLAFKEQNPGKVDNVIPMGAASDLPWHMMGIIESFLDLDQPEEELYVGNVLDVSFLVPGFKEGVRYVNQMYNEGLIDPQFPMYKDGQIPGEQFSQGIMGAMISNYDWALRNETLADLMTNVPTAEIVPVDCFENAKGEKAKTIYPANGLFIIVPAASKNVDGAIQYLNWLGLDNNRNFLTIGEEGTHHILDENQIPVMQAVTGEKIMNSPNNLDYALVVNGVDLRDEEKNLLVLSKSYKPGYEDLFMQAYEASMNAGYVLPTLPTPIESEAKYSNSLVEKRKEILATAISAKPADFDKVYDAGVQEFLTMGGQECLDERRAVWAEEHK